MSSRTVGPNRSSYPYVDIRIVSKNVRNVLDVEPGQELTRRCERAQARIIPLVFHRSGRAIHSFRRSWKEACKKAGVPGLLFHDLRRSAVRNLERASVPRSVAMKLTGHKTESIYRRYAIVAEADLREAGAKLSALADSVQKGQATT